MPKKALELETRNILQSLEEFATFISFDSDLSDLQILSIESVNQNAKQAFIHEKAEVIALPIDRSEAEASKNNSQHYKSLSFK